MGHHPPVDDFRWMRTARPRRLGLGDLLAVVALAALVCGAIAMAGRSDVDLGPRDAFVAVAALLLLMQAGQWWLGGLPAADLSPLIH